MPDAVLQYGSEPVEEALINELAAFLRAGGFVDEDHRALGHIVDERGLPGDEQRQQHQGVVGRAARFEYLVFLGIGGSSAQRVHARPAKLPVERELGRGGDGEGGDVDRRPLRNGIEFAQRVHLVAEELDTAGVFARYRENVDIAASKRDLTGSLADILAHVTRVDELFKQRFRRDLGADGYRMDGVDYELGRRGALHERLDRGDNEALFAGYEPHHNGKPRRGDGGGFRVMPHRQRQLARGEKLRVRDIVKELPVRLDRRHLRRNDVQNGSFALRVKRRGGVHAMRLAQPENAQGALAVFERRLEPDEFVHSVKYAEYTFFCHESSFFLNRNARARPRGGHGGWGRYKRRHFRYTLRVRYNANAFRYTLRVRDNAKGRFDIRCAFDITPMRFDIRCAFEITPKGVSIYAARSI